MSGRVPDKILWDTVKRGFDIPQSFWVSKLSPKIEQWVGDLPANPIFKKDIILSDIHDSSKNGSAKLWSVISTISMLQLMDFEF
jgi:hypothetical protein